MSEPTATPSAVPMGMEPAGFGARAIAIIIDGIILSIVSSILGAITGPFIGLIVSLVLPFAYYIYFWSMDNPVGQKGQTVGKRVMSIKVVADDGTGLDAAKAAIRVVGYFISSIIICIGFLFPLWREDKKALHDLIAGTRVVKA